MSNYNQSDQSGQDLTGMTFDSSTASHSVTPPQKPPEGWRNIQIRFKREGEQLLLLLPPESDVQAASASWADLWQQFKHRLEASEHAWQPRTSVHLIARDQQLDNQQLQEITSTLTTAQLQLRRVYTSAHKTAMSAVEAGYSVEQHGTTVRLNQDEVVGKALAEPLYLKNTIRAGVEIRHPGNVVVVGDINPGAAVIAEGDILIWGSLKGLAHAGSQGNLKSIIMALRMEPTQIRIADKVARGPEQSPSQYHPEVAYVSEGEIRIAMSADFMRTYRSQALATQS